jgi:hypothetical protein
MWNIFKKKTVKQTEKKHISYPDFAIEGLYRNEIIKYLEFDLSDDLKLNDAEKFIWPYYENPNPENKIKAIISEKLDDWTFIYWSCDDLELARGLITKLISVNKNKMNYYSADSVTDNYDWIISENGKIIREFEYCWNVHLNIGEPITEIEKKFIENANKENAEFIFGEDVHNSIFDKTCGIDLKKFGENTEFSVGTFGIEKITIANNV